MARTSYDAFPMPEATIASREESIREHPIVQLKDRLVAELDGRHAGQLTMIPFRMWFTGVRFAMGGVAGVAVTPEARRSGVAQGLLHECFKHMRSRGDVVSLLYPFRHEFYRNYGYGMIGERHVFNVPPASLPAYPGRKRVRAMAREEFPRVYDFYSRLVQSRSVWLERNLKQWAAKLKSPETRVFGVLAEEGEGAEDLSGYLIYEYRDLHGRPGLVVSDYGAEDESSLQAILGFLSSLRDQIEQVRIFAAPDEYFAQRLIEPQFPQRDPIPNLYSRAGYLSYGYMARVLDVQKALALRRYAPCEAMTVALTVRDTTLAGGAVRTVLALGPEGRSLGTRPVGTPARGRMMRASLELPIDIFSQCYFGYLPWTVALREGQGKQRGDEVLPELDRAFKVPLPSMRDLF